MDFKASIKIVDEAYEVILKRKPDEVGFKHFTSLLQQNQLTKEELISLMKNSDEYKDIDLMNNFIKKYDLLFTKNHTKNRVHKHYGRKLINLCTKLK